MAEGEDDLMEEDDWVYYDDNDELCDFWQYFITEQRDFSDPLDIWLRHFTKPYENGYGWNIYREYWRVWVPLLLAPRHGTTSVDQLSEMEEEKLKAILLKPLEQMICGGEDVETVWERLRQADTQPDVCGKVFKAGETCYNCKDCGQDATCVLCVDCFTQSEHKNHRYRMSTSEGGGYCDCGDPEAFKLFPRCQKHELGEGSKQSPSEVLARFPKDLRDRATDLLYSIVKYCLDVVSDAKAQTDLISGLKEKELFPDLKFPLQYSSYTCVLLNDENHSYNDVIRVLKKVLSKPSSNGRLATDLTTFVDKYGKAVISVGNYSECSKISAQIEAHTRLYNSTVLTSKVVPSYIVAHQEFVTRLLSWIPSLFQISSGFRALFAEVMLMRSKETVMVLKKPHVTTTAYTIAQAVLLNDFNSWKQVRSLWVELIIDGLMKDYETKRELAVIFAENYPEILQDYYRDDQERESSIMSLSVQIFTVPSLAHHLLEKCDVMSKMLGGFITLLCENRDANGDLTAWLVEEKSELNRGLMGLNDLTYLLSVVPAPHLWSDSLRTNFRNGSSRVLEVLGLLQGIDQMKRQTGQHVEMEDNGWKITYELQTHFGEVVRLVTSWAVADRTVMVQLIEEALRLINLKHSGAELKEKSKYLAFLGPPKIYELVDFDVTQEKISLNVPLHRFLISLLIESGRQGLDTTLHQRLGNTQHLLEPVLQAVVAVAQISIGMWKRNGSSAESQAFLYNSKRYCPGIKDNDLLMMQMMASLTQDVDTLLVTLLARFKLTKWATGDLEIEPKARSPEFVEQVCGLADQWLGLIIGLTAERFTVGVGVGVDHRAALTQELIQLLCTEALPHSQIVKRFPERKNEAELEDILKEIASLRTCPKTAGRKVYQLKEGLEERYNMFYYGYTREQQTQAQEQQLQQRKAAGEGKDCCPPPRMPRLTRLMAGLVRILQSPVVLQAMLVTLRRATESSPEKRKYVTERHVHKVLFLLALGIQENAVETEHSEFVKKAAACGVFEVVGRLLQDTENLLTPPHIRKLASWVLSNGGHTDPAMETDERSEENDRKKAEAAAARRAKILAQMNKAQRNFAAENKAALASLKETEAREDPAGVDCSEDTQSETVCVGPGMTGRQDCAQLYTCILCQEESQVDGKAVLVLAAFIQKSTVLGSAGAESGQSAVSPHHLQVSRDCAPHVSSCGHAMHSTCYQKFFQSLESKERERINGFGFNRINNFEVTTGEFLCPICERLSNTILPLFPPITSLRKKHPSAPVAEISLNTFISGLKSSVESWYLKEDKENGPALHRMALKATFEEVAKLQGPDFLQYFRQNTNTAQTAESGIFDGNMTSMMNVFSMSTFTSSLELDPYEEDYRVPLLCLQSAAFTLISLERMLWFEDKPLFGGLNPREEDTVRNITRYIALFPSSYNKPQHVNMRDLVKKMKNFVKLQCLQSNAMFILSTLLCKVTPDDTDPLTFDAFGVLVSLLVSLPCLFNSETPPRLPTGQGTEIHCVKLCLLLHIIQVTSSLQPEDLSQFRKYPGRREENKTFDILSTVWKKKGIRVERSELNISKLCSKLEEMVLPYLRCCALMFQHFTDVFPGKVLTSDGGMTYQPLARYLGLPPTLEQFLDNPASGAIMTSILEKEISPATPAGLGSFPLNYRRVAGPSVGCKLLYPLAPLTSDPGWRGGLIPLPRDYTDLMNLAASFRCGNSVAGESKTPVLCLVCGALVCSYSHCCETTIATFKCGGCTSHAAQCAAGTGVFLRIRECFIVIHNKITRGAYLPAPYVDEYGETDKGLRRGNPLMLDQEKYAELNRMWLRNEVPEKIARMFDPDYLLYIEWNQL